MKEETMCMEIWAAVIQGGATFLAAMVALVAAWLAVVRPEKIAKQREDEEAQTRGILAGHALYYEVLFNIRFLEMPGFFDRKLPLLTDAWQKHGDIMVVMSAALSSDPQYREAVEETEELITGYTNAVIYNYLLRQGSQSVVDSQVYAQLALEKFKAYRELSKSREPRLL